MIPIDFKILTIKIPACLMLLIAETEVMMMMIKGRKKPKEKRKTL